MAIPIELNRAEDRLVDAAWARIAQKSANLDRRDDFEPCYICGRPLDTRADGTRWIRVVDGGDSAAEQGEEIDPAGDLGLQPVGRDCLKKHRPALPVAATKKTW